MGIPRGVRNNNPGNIDRTKDRWLGMSKDQSSDQRFVVFDAPEYGIRALMRLLISYYEKYGCDSVSKVINRWAPPSENNTGAYANAVAHQLQVGLNDVIDLMDPKTNLAITKAIIQHENGYPPGREGWYPDHIYQKALVLAGFPTEKPSLATSRTITGSAMAGAASVAGALVDSIPDSIKSAGDVASTALPFNPGMAKTLFLVLTLFGIGVAIYARIDDHRKKLQ